MYLTVPRTMTNEHGFVIAAATDGACSGNPGPGGDSNYFCASMRRRQDIRRSVSPLPHWPRPVVRCGQRSALHWRAVFGEQPEPWRGSSPPPIMILPRSPRRRPQHAHRITKAMERSRGRRDACAHACPPGCSEATMRRDAIRRREARKRPRSRGGRTC